MPQRTTPIFASRMASAALLCALGSSACNHTEPFVSPPNDTDQPFDPSPPVQLTLNRGGDRAPTWLPDGSGILYSAQQGRHDSDYCLALLPPSGGRQRELWCDIPGGADATDVIESSATAPDGRLALVEASSSIGGRVPSFVAIALAPSLDPTAAQTVRSFPYTPEGGITQRRIGPIRWLGDNRLVYLGLTVVIRSPCERCQLDTISTGLAATLFDASQPGSIPSVIPGTDFASGVTPAPSGDAVLYTLGGDTRVFRRVLTTGEVTIVHDFGAAGIARDIHAVGNRLAAVVGGRVAFGNDLELGPTQWDSGGVVHVVNLDTGIDLALEDAARLYRRPALSPAGDQVVVEGFPLIIGVTDTLVDRRADLFLFGAP